MRRHLKPTNKSWRVDETYVRVQGRWCYRQSVPSSTSPVFEQHYRTRPSSLPSLLATPKARGLEGFRYAIDPLAIYLITLIIETEEQRGSSSTFGRSISKSSSVTVSPASNRFATLATISGLFKPFSFSAFAIK